MEKSKYIDSVSLMGLKNKTQRDIFTCFLEFQHKCIGYDFNLLHKELMYIVKTKDIPSDPLDVLELLCISFPIRKSQVFKLIRLYLDEYGQLE